jgi:sugar lactone lactonase YvrE
MRIHHSFLPALTLLGLVATTCQVQAQTLLAGEREAPVTAIAGVVGADAQWTLVWADFVTADGIVGTTDGGVLFAQEQTDKIIKLNQDGSQHTVFENMNAPGSVAIDTSGRTFTVQRTCTEPFNAELAGCNELTRVVQIAPEFRVLASSFADGRPLGRLNDLIADGLGGAFFTSGGLYHASKDGVVSVVAEEDLVTNGLMLSRDAGTLYVTNRDRIVAFDVAADASTSNRRDFVIFEGETFTDGIALDAEGRLYVTAGQGIHVVGEAGDFLGTIPTPRAAITAAFSGPDKKMLYVPMMGAVGPDGKAWATPEGIRNTAMTIYTLPMLTSGFGGRPK